MQPVVILPKLVSAQNDYVTYTYKKDNKEVNNVDKPCYAEIMSMLDQVEAVLLPHAVGEAQLPGETFLSWIDLCKKNGLIPPEFVAYNDDKGNHLKIVSNDHDKHVIYTTLCCYRWSDANAPMIWQLVEHSKTSGATFWQLLHFALATHKTYGAGHNFTYIYKTGSVYSSGDRNNDLCQSLAAKHFMLQTPIKERKSILGYTNNAVVDIATKFGSTAAIKATTLSNTLNVINMNNMLTKKFNSLYEIDNPTSDGLFEEYSRIIKNAA